MDVKFDPKVNYDRHPRAHPQGGVFLTEQAANVATVAVKMVKSVGYKLKEEGVLDLLKISRPAIISYHKTFLECVAADFHNTHFLDKAAATRDPLERMKYVVAFYLSGTHRNSAEMQNMGPLNPILGETYSAVKKDGTSLYCEQISHHPPVSAYLLYGPNKSYKLYGTGELEVKLNGVNNIAGRRMGKTTVEFPDGTKIVFTNPDTRIDGLLVGDRRYNYIKSCIFLDKKNQISAEINFLYDETNTVSKFASSIKKIFVSNKKVKTTTDQFEISFYAYNKANNMNKTVLCEGTGSWLSHIQVNNQLLWTVKQEDSPWIEDMKDRLPSDSLFREDSKFIKMKDFDAAQREKDNLENKQRNDEKLRKANEEMRTKSRQI